MPVYSEPLPEGPSAEDLKPIIKKHWYDEHDFYGELSDKDGLSSGTIIRYRFAYSKPVITQDLSGHRIDFLNAVITIPLSGIPVLITEDIFECVITNANKEYHLGG